MSKNIPIDLEDYLKRVDSLMKTELHRLESLYPSDVEIPSELINDIGDITTNRYFTQFLCSVTPPFTKCGLIFRVMQTCKSYRIESKIKRIKNPKKLHQKRLKEN